MPPLLPQQLPLFESKASAVDGATTAEIQRYLAQADFPASKARLIERVHQRDAPPAVLAALDRLPGRRYQGMIELTIALARGH